VVRERIVGRSLPGSAEVKIRVVPDGGSSRSFKRAFAASELDSWGANASASAMMKT
jgi:hypothetical protein